MSEQNPITEQAATLLAAATPGPWTLVLEHHGDPLRDEDHLLVESTADEGGHVVTFTSYSTFGATTQKDADAEFIAAAPGLVAGLLAVIEQKNTELTEARTEAERWRQSSVSLLGAPAMPSDRLPWEA